MYTDFTNNCDNVQVLKQVVFWYSKPPIQPTVNLRHRELLVKVCKVSNDVAI